MHHAVQSSQGVSKSLNQIKSKEDFRLNSEFPNRQKNQKCHVFPSALLGQDENQVKWFPLQF